MTCGCAGSTSESDSGLGAVLGDAEASCGSSRLRRVTSRSQRVRGATLTSSLNGVAEFPRYGWRIGGRRRSAAERSNRADRLRRSRLPQVRGDGRKPGRGAASERATQSKRPKRHRAHGPRIAVLRKAQCAGGDRRSRYELRCPRGLGEGGCRGPLTAQFRQHGGGRLLAGGSTPFAVGSGDPAASHDPGRRGPAPGAGRRPRVKLRLTAATRDEAGASGSPTQSGSSPGEQAARQRRHHGRPCGRGGGCAPRRPGRDCRPPGRELERRRPFSTGRSTSCHTRSTAATAAAPTLAGSAGSAGGATATSTLDDAMRGAGISWRGNWDPSFRDFFIDSIGPYASAAPDRYWSLTVNGHFARRRLPGPGRRRRRGPLLLRAAVRRRRPPARQRRQRKPPTPGPR